MNTITLHKSTLETLEAVADLSTSFLDSPQPTDNPLYFDVQVDAEVFAALSKIKNAIPNETWDGVIDAVLNAAAE